MIREWNALPPDLVHVAPADEFAARLQNHTSRQNNHMFLTVNTELLTMLMASLARDADALGSIKVEVEVSPRLLCPPTFIRP